MKEQKPRSYMRIQKVLSQTAVVTVISLVLGLAFFFTGNYLIHTVQNIGTYATNMLRYHYSPMRNILPALGKAFSVNLDYAWITLLVFGISLFFSLRIAYQMKKNYGSLIEDQKGSRRWTTVKELEEQYRAIPDKKKQFDGTGGIPISRYGNTLFIDDSPVNNLIIGTTRSGKGEVLVVSMIDVYSRPKRIEDRASLIINDPKGELFCSSKETLQDRGYSVMAIDLLTFLGLGFNPLEIVKSAYLRGDKAEAQLLAKTVSFILFNDPTAKDKTWQNWSIALTNALILAHVIDCCKAADNCTSLQEKKEWYGKINMYSVARLLIDLMNETIDDDGDKYPIDKFFADRPSDDVAKMQYASVAGATGKTKGNIFSNTLAELTKFTMDNIARVTARNTIDLKSIGFNTEQPTALFMITPDYDTSNHFLVTMFISQLYFVLSKTASMSGGKCHREVVFLLDEVGNLKPIPDLANICTVCLGRRIRFNLIVQAYSQIYKLYGKEDAQTIIGNCGNQIYLLTIELETAKQFSQLIGDKTITTMQRHGDPLSMSKHFMENTEGKPLLNPNELMELKEGEIVVVRVTKRQDLSGNKITANPIFCHDKTEMKYRYEYLADDFDTSKPLEEMGLEIGCQHKNLDLSTIVYSPFLSLLSGDTEINLSNPDPSEQLLKDKVGKVAFNRYTNILSENYDVDYLTLANITVAETSEKLKDLMELGIADQEEVEFLYLILHPHQHLEKTLGGGNHENRIF